MLLPERYQVQTYETQEGDVPFESWIEDLRDRNARARLRKRIKRVESGALGDYRFVGDGVFEFKIDYGPGYRIYAARVGLTILILLCGGDKGTQGQDIVQAKKFLADFKERTHGNP